MFGDYGLLIIAHGAALMNGLFLPPRSVIIEIYAYGG
jgi:hypothetical protein